jgi:nucleoside permease NupC
MRSRASERRCWHNTPASSKREQAPIFVGMTEAPLLIWPYLSQLTRTELFAVMTAGMATIAGTVMVLYFSCC